MKTLIAVPAMDQVASEFAYSLAAMDKVGECVLGFEISSLIYDARNELVKRAVALQTDYILWLDSDMVFGRDLMYRLMDDMDGRDMVSGLYFRRKPPYYPVISKHLKTAEKFGEAAEEEPFLDYPDEIFEIAGCGFGCVMLRTEACVEMALAGKEWFKPYGGVGEDLAFCSRMTEIGRKMYCDPTIKLGHVGRAIVTEDVFQRMKNAK